MNSKIKILFVIPNAKVSGAEKQLLLLMANIDRDRFYIEVCSLEGSGKFSQNAEKLGIPVHIINRNISCRISSNFFR